MQEYRRKDLREAADALLDMKPTVDRLIVTVGALAAVPVLARLSRTLLQHIMAVAEARSRASRVLEALLQSYATERGTRLRVA